MRARKSIDIGIHRPRHLLILSPTIQKLQRPVDNATRIRPNQLYRSSRNSFGPLSDLAHYGDWLAESGSLLLLASHEDIRIPQCVVNGDEAIALLRETT
jgi:hypothetical protein